MDEWEKDLADAIRHDPSVRDAIVELAYRDRAQKIYPPYAGRKHDGSLAAALCKLIGLQPSEFNKLSREARIPYLNAAIESMPEPKGGEQEMELSFREQCIVDSIGNGELTGQEISDKSGYLFNSRLRQTLADMVKAGKLIKGSSGQRYRKP